MRSPPASPSLAAPSAIRAELTQRRGASPSPARRPFAAAPLVSLRQRGASPAPVLRSPSGSAAPYEPRALRTSNSLTAQGPLTG